MKKVRMFVFSICALFLLSTAFTTPVKALDDEMFCIEGWVTTYSESYMINGCWFDYTRKTCVSSGAEITCRSISGCPNNPEMTIQCD